MEDVAPGAVGRVLLDALPGAGQDGHPPLSAQPAQLQRQPRFANAGLALDEQHLELACGDRLQQRRQASQLGLASDQRRVDCAPKASLVTRPTGWQTGTELGLAFDAQRRQRLEHPAVAGAAAQVLVAQDLPRLRCHHQPRGQVGLVAQNAVRSPRRAAIGSRAHLPHRDADTHIPDEFHMLRRRDQFHGRADRAGRVIVMRLRRAERRVQIAPLVAKRYLDQGSLIAGNNLLHPMYRGVKLVASRVVAVVVDAGKTHEKRCGGPQLGQELALIAAQAFVDCGQDPRAQEGFVQAIRDNRGPRRGRNRCVYRVDHGKALTGCRVDPPRSYNRDVFPHLVQQSRRNDDLAGSGQLFGACDLVQRATGEHVDQTMLR